MSDPYNRPGQLDPQAKNSLEKLSIKNEPMPRDIDIDDPIELKKEVLHQIDEDIDYWKEKSTEKTRWLERLRTIIWCETDFDFICSINLQEEYKEIHSMPKALYELLLSVLASERITAVPDLLGPYAGFKLYSSKTLKNVKGLKVPKQFLLLDYFPTRLQNRMAKMLQQGIYSYLRYGKYRTSLVGEFKPLLQPWSAFISPLINPKVNYRSSTLFGQIERELSSLRCPGSEDMRIAANVSDFPHLMGQGRIDHPLKVVPAADWFPNELKQLLPEHIVTIFQPTELKVFMLLIGRALVGPDGNSPCGYPDYTIEHTARIAGILKGTPGSGKSTILSLIAKAMETYGYSAKPFRSLDDRFGMGEIADADLAYRDDSSMSDLEAITKSSTFKSYVTGGKICAEKKNKDASYVSAKGVVLLAANNWNPTQAYNTDDGNRSRLRLIETLEPSVRDKKLKGLDPSHPWYGLTSLDPAAVVEHLCQRYKVDAAVVMGWFFRCCADYFYQSIPTLESIDRTLESKLTTRIAANLSKPLTKTLKLVLCLMGKNGSDALTRSNLLSALEGLDCILSDCRSYQFLQVLKQQWEKTYRSQEHTWVCIRDVRYECIAKAVEVGNTADVSLMGNGTFDEFIKRVLAVVYTRGGIAAGNSPSGFLANWESPDTQMEVKALYEATKGLLPDGFFTVDDNDLAAPCKKWYNPALQNKQITKRRKLALDFYNQVVQDETGDT